MRGNRIQNGMAFAQNKIAHGILEIWALFDKTLDVADAHANLDQDTARRKSEIDAATAQGLQQAESNRTAVVPIVPNRGVIMDRNGIVLATNYSAYTLEITPSKVPDLEGLIDELATVIEIAPRDRRRFRKLLEETKRFESLPIRNRITDDEIARFAANRYRFPGVEIKARLFRQYPQAELFSHVVGHIGRINQREAEAMDDWPDED